MHCCYTLIPIYFKIDNLSILYRIWSLSSVGCQNIYIYITFLLHQRLEVGTHGFHYLYSLVVNSADNCFLQALNCLWYHLQSLKARGSPFSLQEDVNLEPLYSSMESGPVQQPLPLPEGYPKNSILDQQSLAYHGVPLSMEGKKEFLAVTRNCIELLSSMLNSESQNKPVKVIPLSFL